MIGRSRSFQMRLADGLRSAVPPLWRRLPRTVRKRSRYTAWLNRLALRMGARPVVVGRMRAGHRMRLDLRSGTEWPSFYTGEYDEERIEAARDLLRRPGSLVVDAGANIGLWTVPLARWVAARGGRVVAVEPVPANAQRLRQNLWLNGVEAVVEVRRLVLSDRRGVARMSLREDFAQGAATGNAAVLIGDEGDRDFSWMQAPAVPLDEVLAELGSPRVDVVKADLEGHEDRFLAGGMRTFARWRPVAFFEWNPVYYRRREVDPTVAMRPLLRRLGYRCLRLDRDGWRDDEAFVSPRPFDDLVLAPTERVADVRATLDRFTRRRS